MDSLRTQEVRTPVLGPIPAQPDCLPPGLVPLPSTGIHCCSGHQSLQVPPCSAARMPGSVWLSGPEANFPESLQAGGPLELGKSACFSLLPKEARVVGPHHGPNRNHALLVSLQAPEGEFLAREPPSASLGAQEPDCRERDAGTLISHHPSHLCPRGRMVAPGKMSPQCHIPTMSRSGPGSSLRAHSLLNSSDI